MKNFIFAFILTLGSLATLSVSAQTLDKVFDGAAGYCPEPEPIRYNQQARYVSMKINGEHVEIKPVRCSPEGFVLDTQLTNNQYKTIDQVIVTESYSQFELLVSRPDLSAYKKIALPFFVADLEASISLNDIRSVGEVVDLQIMARIDFETNKGYKDFDFVRFGAFRLRF